MTPADSISQVEKGRKEAVAQLEIMTALSKVSDESARRIVQAIGLLLEADKLVPGIITQLSQRMSS